MTIIICYVVGISLFLTQIYNVFNFVAATKPVMALVPACVGVLTSENCICQQVSGVPYTYLFNIEASTSLFNQ